MFIIRVMVRVVAELVLSAGLQRGRDDEGILDLWSTDILR